MKKRLLIGILLGATLLTACSEKEFEKSVETGVKNAVEGIGNITSNMVDDIAIFDEGIYQIEEKYISESSENSKVEIGNEVGKIFLNSGDVDKVEVRVVRKNGDQKLSEAESQKVLNTIETKVKEVDGKYSIDISFNKIKDRIIREKVNVDVYVIIPKNVKSVELEQSVGSIEVKDYVGHLEAGVDVGSINLVGVNGVIDASTEVGSIYGKALDIGANSKFTTEVGSVELGLHGLEDFNVEIEIGSFSIDYDGEYNLVENGQGNVNPGIPTIRVEKEL